uniref:DUF1152 domain-containing protein n=1 Tax=Geoglobus ahangari TaxID=113653 RepID=A0A7C4S6C5_9EURY
MQIIDIVKTVRKALLIGIGGGGDILSTLYVKRFLEKFDVECVLGGVVWERYRRDKKPGPRSLEEINAEKIHDTLGFVDGNERIGGIQPIVSQVAEFLNEKIVAVDITKGVVKLREDLKNFIKEEGFDVVFGVDAGGDSLAKGFEVTLISPLADSIMLSVLKDFNSILAVVGFGSDCELTRDQLERYLSELSNEILGVSMVMNDDWLFELVKNVESEASRIPMLAAKGYYGDYYFWGEVKTRISILNSLIFYLRLKPVFERSQTAKAVVNAKSFEEAYNILKEMGVRTEYDLELELARRENPR